MISNRRRAGYATSYWRWDDVDGGCVWLALGLCVTWKHVAGLALALAVPVICILSPTCATAGLKDVMSLSLVVAGGVLGNAQRASEHKDKPAP